MDDPELFHRGGTNDPQPLSLDARQIRGEVSNGMLASAHELALSDDHSGIVEVEVKDEEQIAVENAEVSLYNADTNFLAPYTKKITDAIKG